MRERLSITTLTRKALIRITLVALCATVLTAPTVYQSFRNSVHVVIPNQVYRSAQLSANSLQRVVNTQHIQSVINLRGSNPQTAWYQQELTASQKLGVHHYDVTLSSYRLPPTDQLQKLVHLLQYAPRPILLHCQSGIDRTGLASALALILDKNTPVEQAKHQFSLLYMDTSRNSVGKRVFPYYTYWLQKNKLANSGNNLQKWAYSENPFDRQDNVDPSRFVY